MITCSFSHGEHKQILLHHDSPHNPIAERWNVSTQNKAMTVMHEEFVPAQQSLIYSK
jgi:hypothetical protein